MDRGAFYRVAVSSVPQRPMSPFRIVHISDVHIPPLPRLRPRDFAGKRLLALVSWHKKWKAEHRPEIIEALARVLEEIRPDHTCITGDLTFTGHPEEIERSVHWLEALGPATAISLVPGNHDAYVPGALEHACRRWAPWMTDDEAGDQRFPYLHRRGPVDLIGLCSGVPLRLPRTTGRVGDVQLEGMRRMLQRIEGSGRTRILLIHHPPQDGAARRGKELVDRAALREVLSEHPVDLVLHGHLHRPVGASLPGPVTVAGAGSASSLGRRYAPAHFHVFELGIGTGGQPTIRLRHGTYDAKRGSFELGPDRPLKALH